MHNANSAGSARVSRWGNSLALRLPKNVAESQGLKEGDELEFVPEAGGLLLRKSSGYSLESLVAGISDENRHGEADFGPAQGVEEW